jgi:hypothetical protein
VLRGEAPPRHAHHAGAAHLLRREAAHRGCAARGAVERTDGVVTRLLPENVAHERQVFDGVAVGVDHRVVEASLDPADVVARNELHAELYCDAATPDFGSGSRPDVRGLTIMRGV